MLNSRKVLFAILITLISVIVLSATDFPLRKKFKNVPVIEIKDLKADYDKGNVIIIDTRSKIEFAVIHIKGALHIPLSNRNFVKNVKKLISKNKDKKFVFYCNGITCSKAYRSTKKLQEEGLKNIFAFDGGVPMWVNDYPSETMLFDKAVTDPKKQVIPKKDFTDLCLTFDDFKAKAKSSNTVVIDARDFIQASEKLPGFEKVLSIPLDKLIPNIIAKKRMQDKHLLIFDQVGKQVRWLMYYLKKNGYKNFNFLKKGATEVLKKEKYRE